METYNQTRKFRRSNDRVLTGVSGGIAEYFDLAPWGVRLLWVLLFFFGFPFIVIAYIVLAFAMKAPEFGLPPPIPGHPSNHCTSRGEMLNRLHERMERLNSRLQRMESIVTDPAYQVRREFDSLL